MMLILGTFLLTNATLCQREIDRNSVDLDICILGSINHIDKILKTKSKNNY